MIGLCTVYEIVQRILYAYTLVLFAYALVSWVPSLRGRWFDYVAMLVEPVLAPVRRVIPAAGGLDLSFLVVLLVVQFVARNAVPNYC